MNKLLTWYAYPALAVTTGCSIPILTSGDLEIIPGGLLFSASIGATWPMFVLYTFKPEYRYYPRSEYRIAARLRDANVSHLMFAAEKMCMTYACAMIYGQYDQFSERSHMRERIQSYEDMFKYSPEKDPSIPRH